MLFHSSIRRELTKNLGASLVVLLTIVMTMMLIRTLGLANRGNINPQDVMLVMWFALLGHLPTVINLAMMVATTSVLSRMYRDSETVVWLSSGLAFAQLARQIVRVWWPVWCVVAALSLVAWPWANQQSQLLQQRFAQRGNLERIAPGQFQISNDRKSVFFIENNLQISDVGKQVFVYRQGTDGEHSVTSAARVELRRDEEGLKLVFSQGQMVQILKDKAWQVHRFEDYILLIDESKDGPSGEMTWPPKAMWTWDLLSDPNPLAKGELAWRVGVVLSSINLVLLAIASTSNNPRSGKSWSLIFLILVFLVYFNLASLAQNWVNRQTMTWISALLALHTPVALGAVLAMAIRNGWQPWRSHKRGAHP